MNVLMIDIVMECMMSTSICEINMSWYAYVLQKMLGGPNSCGIGISKRIKKYTMCILSMNHASCCACVFWSEGCLWT